MIVGNLSLSIVVRYMGHILSISIHTVLVESTSLIYYYSRRTQQPAASPLEY